MALKVIKNSSPKKDRVENSSPENIFIIEVKNQKGELGYVGKHLDKIFVFGEICSEVIKFKSAKDAREVTKKISNVQTRILNREKIERVLSQQKNVDVTIPIEDIKEDLYCVSIIDINTNEKLGYIAYKPELKQYYMKTDKNGVAFWEGEKNVTDFIETAKGLIANHKNLKLEKELLKDKENV
jgi:hypothetical protein